MESARDTAGQGGAGHRPGPDVLPASPSGAATIATASGRASRRPTIESSESDRPPNTIAAAPINDNINNENENTDKRKRGGRTLTEPSACWPCRPCTSVSVRVFSSEPAQQQHDSGGREQLRPKPKSSVKRTKKPRSESLQAELSKMEMHQRLLNVDHKRLLDELRHELHPGGLNSAAVGPQRCPQQVAVSRADHQLDGRRAAVQCDNLSYRVGFGAFRRPILDGVSLTVPEGAIYGLLGPSGCGKTTMLRCVAGRLTPESGSIKVFGFEPNEPGSRIPGPAIGFMPQVSKRSAAAPPHNAN
jgi:hypothetical protein